MATPKLPAKAVVGQIRLDVVTPSGVALQELVDELTAPSVNGHFGVLAGHLPLLAALKTGLVSYRKGTETFCCVVGPGFVEVADDYALLLTDRYSDKEAIDIVATRTQLKDIQEQLEKWNQEPWTPEHHALIAEESWNAALLELFGDPPPPTMRALEPHELKTRSPSESLQDQPSSDV